MTEATIDKKKLHNKLFLDLITTLVIRKSM